jgi:hypothetical protein
VGGYSWIAVCYVVRSGLGYGDGDEFAEMFFNITSSRRIAQHGRLNTIYQFQTSQHYYAFSLRFQSESSRDR